MRNDCSILDIMNLVINIGRELLERDNVGQWYSINYCNESAKILRLYRRTYIPKHFVGFNVSYQPRKPVIP